METKPSKQTYDALQSAYDHFNRRLWRDRLPQCIILLHRKRGALGYFHARQFLSKSSDERLDEIALNPEWLIRNERDAISTLVHEMAHLWQQHFGSPSRKGYHNKEWADEMDRIGLRPSHDGTMTGRRTGQRMTHCIVEDGLFAQAFSDWPEAGHINWAAVSRKSPRLLERNKDKVKYTCTMCGSRVWGKLGLSPICGRCFDDQVGIVRMLSASFSDAKNIEFVEIYKS